MASIVFLNPNEPEQPTKGVYRWFCRDSTKEFTLYVGNSGERQTSGTPSTLKRGVLEAQRSCISSNKGSSLDTDFVVGTALVFFKRLGFDCVWEHVSNNPTEELQFCNEFQPQLQSRRTGKIHREFKLTKPGGALWGKSDFALAEASLLAYFAQHFNAIAAERPRFSVMPKAMELKSGINLSGFNRLVDDLEVETFTTNARRAD